MNKLKELRDKATSGEWEAQKMPDGIYLTSKHWAIAEMNDIEEMGDAEYIAALHNANLIDRVEELEAELEKAVRQALKAAVLAEHWKDSSARWKEACGDNVKEAYDKVRPVPKQALIDKLDIAIECLEYVWKHWGCDQPIDEIEKVEAALDKIKG